MATWQAGMRITADRLNNPVPTLITSGVTAATGWSVTLQTLYVVSGVRIANVTVTRTGGDMTDPGGTGGNVTPDITVCTAAADWRPPDSVYVCASTGINSGSVRIQNDGVCQLLDWPGSQDITNGSNLRFTWTFTK